LKLRHLYELLVFEGIKTDSRSRSQIQKDILKKKQLSERLGKFERKFFDKEVFKNPYSDTRILFGDPDKEVQRILVGIDIEVGELLLADQLSRGEKKIDLVLAHHPEGMALAGLHEVMSMQADMLVNRGFNQDVAHKIMQKRINEVSRRLHGTNHTRTPDAAKLLNIPLMCCHTPSDNHVAQFLQRLFDRKKPKTLQHVLDLLLKEPEYQDATVNKAGPTIILGKPKDKAGRIMVDMTGGTEGSVEVFARLSQLGVTTQVAMHLSENHFNHVKNEHMNVVIAGHIASDNLGMNLLLDKIEKKYKLEIVECSGFRRIRRSWR
jgi:putative NIF3 family GTP cyclohydrolase 1 type 2